MSLKLKTAADRNSRPHAGDFGEVAVVIPTKNAGQEFPLLLSKLRMQKNVGQLEIIIVDSGSSDSTVDIARRFGCKIIRIQSSEFTHAFARNRGADAASPASRALLFMVQDALPSTDLWLHEMMQFLYNHSKDDLVALSCVEFPRHDSDLFYNFLIYRHYNHRGFLNKDRIFKWDGRSPTLIKKRGRLSNIACLIKRDVFEKYKFREDFAEDIDLAQRLLKDGRRVACLSSVKVIHSHRRPPFYFLKRRFVSSTVLEGLKKPSMGEKFDSVEDYFASICNLFHIICALSHRMRHLENGMGGERLCSFVLTEIVQAIVRGKKKKIDDKHEWRELEDEKLTSFIRCLSRHKRERATSANFLVQKFLATFISAHRFINRTYSVPDLRILSEYRGLLVKLACAVAGEGLGQLYLRWSQKEAYQGMMTRMRSVLIKDVLN